eukprot:765994-Hanusia_phi.AAC.1
MQVIPLSFIRKDAPLMIQVDDLDGRSLQSLLFCNLLLQLAFLQLPTSAYISMPSRSVESKPPLMILMVEAFRACLSSTP